MSILYDFRISYLLAKSVADLIQILGLKEIFGAPSLDPLLIIGVIVQCEDGFNVLPLSFLGCYPGSSFVFWISDELVNNSKALRFLERFVREGLTRFLFRCGNPDAMDPIFHSVKSKPLCDSKPQKPSPRAVDLSVDMLITRNLDKDKKRVIFSGADFRSKTD